MISSYIFFFNDTATTEIYTLSLHDALPILYEGGSDEAQAKPDRRLASLPGLPGGVVRQPAGYGSGRHRRGRRSEEHTSELQSRQYLVCRLLLEKKKTTFLLLILPVFEIYNY